ncbi:MAG: hypothetical protein ABFD70_00870, partial [Syntrophaceae bacterium]
QLHTVPVSGEKAETDNLADEGIREPVSAPVAKMRGACVLRASALGDPARNQMPMPRPPRNDRDRDGSREALRARLEFRSIYRQLRQNSLCIAGECSAFLG